MEFGAYITIFLMGLGYGSTICMFSCASILTSVMIGDSVSLKRSFKSISIFSAGRVFSYSLIAFGASFGSLGIKKLLQIPYIWGELTGTMMILTSFYLLYSAFIGKKSCKGFHGNKGIKQGSYFLMGLFMSFNLCAPIMALITFSASSSSPLISLVYGFLFGLGAILFSLLLYGFILSSITKELMFQFSKYKKSIEVLASLSLFGVGVAVSLGVFKL